MREALPEGVVIEARNVRRLAWSSETILTTSLHRLIGFN
jgi:hypothetical protein